jgi:16S rRNA (guanine966-N2)-methyltransferase
MRIIGGIYKSRRLQPPSTHAIRPTTDRMRETLFNMLEAMPGFRWEGCHVLDAFAGTGALGLEALSRGAEHVTFWESNAKACQLVRTNMQILQQPERAQLVHCNALHPPATDAQGPFDLIFLDPPYGKGLAQACLEGLEQRRQVQAGAFCVWEDSATCPMPDLPHWAIVRERKGGETRLVILNHQGIGSGE